MKMKPSFFFGYAGMTNKGIERGAFKIVGGRTGVKRVR